MHVQYAADLICPLSSDSDQIVLSLDARRIAKAVVCIHTGAQEFLAHCPSCVPRVVVHA